MVPRGGTKIFITEADPHGRGAPPYFRKFYKKIAENYIKKISSIFPNFKIQFIYSLFLYVIFKKFFRIDKSNKQLRQFLEKKNFIIFYALEI